MSDDVDKLLDLFSLILLQDSFFIFQQCFFLDLPSLLTKSLMIPRKRSLSGYTSPGEFFNFYVEPLTFFWQALLG